MNFHQKKRNYGIGFFIWSESRFFFFFFLHKNGIFSCFIGKNGNFRWCWNSGMESDEEIRRVPEFGGEMAGPSTSGREAGSAAGTDRAQAATQAGQRKRGRSPADKEHKRLKRWTFRAVESMNFLFFFSPILYIVEVCLGLCLILCFVNFDGF